MASKILTIEVGEQISKVCVSVPKGSAYHILDSFMFLTPESAVADGVINDAGALAAELGRQLRSHAADSVKSVVFTITSSRIATRLVSLPPMKESRIKGVVLSSATEYFPIDLSRHHITYSLLERSTGGKKPGCRVMVIAAPLALLEGYFTVADRLKMTIRAIDYSGNSQYQALKALGEKSAVMYVNVDCNNFFATFMKGDKLLLQRSIGIGGNEMVVGYMRSTEMSAEQYVEALTACSEDDVSFFSRGVFSAEEANSSLQRLVTNIARSNDYLSSVQPNVQTEKVVLMGTCCHLAGLRQAVADTTGLETVTLDELMGLSNFTNNAKSASFYISCMGCPINPVDLMPEQLVAKRRGSKKKSNDSLVGGVVVCLLCVLIAVVLSLTALGKYREALKEKQDLETEIEQLAYTEEVYNTYLAYQAGADALVQLDADIQSPNDQLLAFIGELEAKMPRDILVLTAVCSQTDISMNVNVPGFEEAAVVIAQLREFESIADVRVSTLSEELDETGGTFVSFAVSCTYVVPEAAVETPAVDVEADAVEE